MNLRERAASALGLRRGAYLKAAAARSGSRMEKV
jgi:hypothetical protein